MDALNVSNLGKAYKQYSSRWARLAEWMLPFLAPHHELKWVLKELNFSVKPGEALGIIGINGAGKSTLLKMIAGTVQPTEGLIAINGKVVALLELGMGFHPDFTGRQNVYMAGQLLGYSSGEISSLMSDIEGFAEIGDYMDEPVRIYSSGMQMRLAFSVATVRRPDLLIVDEALSVGDTYFQHKSFDRIRGFRKQGTALLIVSHDKSALLSICDQAILLNKGSLTFKGRPEDVFNYYNALLSDSEGVNIRINAPLGEALQMNSGHGGAFIKSVKLYDGVNKKCLTHINVGQKVFLDIDIELKADLENLVVGYEIKNRLGISIYGTNTHHMGLSSGVIKKGNNFIYSFAFLANLGPGSYSVSVALHKEESHVTGLYEWRDNILIFEVINNGAQFIGLNWLPPTLKVRSYG